MKRPGHPRGRSLSLWAALLLPAGLALLALLCTPLGGSGFSQESVRGGTYLILCLGTLSVLGSRRVRRVPWEEFVGVASAWIWSFALMGSASGASVVAVTLLAAYALLLLARAFRFSGVGSASVLLLSAAVLGSFFLVPPHAQSMPEHFVDRNPLAQIHMAIMSEDWIHGPLLYPRVGGHYFRSPDVGPFLLRAGIAAALCTALAAGGLLIRRRKSTNDADPLAPAA